MKWIPFNPDWQTFSQSIGSAGSSATETKEPGHQVSSEPAATAKVVVAEDDDISREIVCTLLRNWGFEVIVTRDGREAMEALRAENGPVLAVLDWMMPGVDGLEICRRIRETGRLVYILLLTARSAKEHIVEGLQAGADDYLIKPFNKEELHARLKSGLRVLMLQTTLSDRVDDLQKALDEIRDLKANLII
jgi:sigma-B regulation protein RsbU (phosphoserine phosphatase)